MSARVSKVSKKRVLRKTARNARNAALVNYRASSRTCPSHNMPISSENHTEKNSIFRINTDSDTPLHADTVVLEELVHFASGNNRGTRRHEKMKSSSGIPNDTVLLYEDVPHLLFKDGTPVESAPNATKYLWSKVAQRVHGSLISTTGSRKVKEYKRTVILPTSPGRVHRWHTER